MACLLEETVSFKPEAVVAVESGGSLLEEAGWAILLLITVSKAVELRGFFATVGFVCDLISLGRIDDFASLGLVVFFPSEVMVEEVEVVVPAFVFELSVLLFMFQISLLLRYMQ